MVYSYHPGLKALDRAVTERERRVIEMRAITGRSDVVAQRGVDRLERRWPGSGYLEWRRRAVLGQWDQRGRLQAMGFAV